ncbi:MAG: ferritin family protein [Deltaproteobacteria bacterium]|nr:ferritin family protein [Deltaproteobacteria bacterium]
MYLFNLAMALEREIEAFYKRLSEKTDSPGLKKIFIQLAADEEKHCRAVEALKRGMGDSPMRDSILLNEAGDLFKRLVQERPTFLDSDDLPEAYLYAMSVEADSSRLYQNAAKQENNPEVKKVLAQIALEEKKHFILVENLYNFVNAPNEYLAWREFSNIDEFTNFGREVDS